MTARLKSAFLACTFLCIIAMPGCIGGGDDSSKETLGVFPEFESVADDGETYDNARMAGSGFIVLFSAEWCNTPCHSVMHHLYEATNGGATVLVMSTDPSEDITLEEWHQDANDYDDQGDDTGVTLVYPFMKNVNGAAELGVTSRPTVYFVDGDGDIMAMNEGAFDDDQAILDAWDLVK